MTPQMHILPDQSSFPVGSISPRAGKSRRLWILLIGRDRERLSTQVDILSAAGWAVRSAAPEEVSDLVIANFYRVAAFDHSLSDAEAAELAICTRAVNPRTKLLLVVDSKSRPRFIEALFDAIVFHSELPAALTRLLELIAEKSQLDG
jgi:DNA-binding NtrC family response regulator